MEACFRCHSLDPGREGLRRLQRSRRVLGVPPARTSRSSPSNHKVGDFEQTHPQVVEQKGKAYCLMCHNEKTLLLRLPRRPRSRTRRASEDARRRVQGASRRRTPDHLKLCLNCHGSKKLGGTEFCNNCHHKGADPNKPFLPQHMALANKQGRCLVRDVPQPGVLRQVPHLGAASSSSRSGRRRATDRPAARRAAARVALAGCGRRRAPAGRPSRPRAPSRSCWSSGSRAARTPKAYALFFKSDAIPQSLAEASAKETTATRPPIPQWETPYVSKLTSAAADVVVVWKQDAAFPGHSAATVFGMEHYQNRWVVIDASDIARPRQDPAAAQAVTARAVRPTDPRRRSARRRLRATVNLANRRTGGAPRRVRRSCVRPSGLARRADRRRPAVRALRYPLPPAALRMLYFRLSPPSRPVRAGPGRPARKALPTYGSYGPRAAARAERLRLPRALDHVRTRVRHGALDAGLRDVSARLHDHGRVPRAPRHARAHRQPRRAHAQPARLRRRGRDPRAWTRSPSASTCTGCRTPTARSRSREICKKLPPRHAGHLRRPVVELLPRGARQLPCGRLRAARRLHRGAAAPADDARSRAGAPSTTSPT